MKFFTLSKNINVYLLNKTKIYLFSLPDKHLVNYGKLYTQKKKQLKETKINYNKKQANIKYYNAIKIFLNIIYLSN